ncbi:Vesicle transport protein [Klebsormidium nitens]|uniref:PRA1 family protein n=1 Tax=Klebsormidium nitens TaxID=105231 RepID=A0A1Y1I4F0_KLENI|nr:Vesicle transport protein [Klebsormidium nitens]|eukprot:GAQ85810.1 Vesicle transport protein [Klebsormidium nitens]
MEGVWSNVTLEELVDNLQEVDWTTRPRPLNEFFSKFSTPRNLQGKLTSRLKCNAYYYRTNYFLLVLLTLALAFARNPAALIAVAVAGFSAMCLNDSFALSLDTNLMRAIRRIHPPTAARLRGVSVHAGPRTKPGSSRSRGVILICGQDRRAVVAVLFTFSAVLWWLTSAIVTVFGALAASIVMVLAHASFRTPNLKARLNSFREEFRKVWSEYSEA